MVLKARRSAQDAQEPDGLHPDVLAIVAGTLKLSKPSKGLIGVATPFVIAMKVALYLVFGWSCASTVEGRLNSGIVNVRAPVFTIMPVTRCTLMRLLRLPA